MRGVRERSEVERLDDQVIRLRIMARRLWNALRARSGLEAEALFNDEELRVADIAFDAAETVWESQRISVVPCRTALDPAGAMSPLNGWPTQREMYLGRWPDGSTRNLTREQLLMMAGMDTSEPVAIEEEMPF